MTIAGCIYGVVLNDRIETDAMSLQFSKRPYRGAPKAPVVYVRPRGCLSAGTVQMPAGATELTAGATLAMLFRRDAACVSPGAAMDCVGGVALALDLALPRDGYYRPAVAERAGDRLLPLGAFVRPVVPAAIDTLIDGKLAHRWLLDRLVRPIEGLIADLSGFMTLKAGDLLLIGLPGDAPRVHTIQSVKVEADGLPTLSARIEGTEA